MNNSFNTCDNATSCRYDLGRCYILALILALLFKGATIAACYLLEIKEMLSGRSVGTKSQLRVILDDGSLKDKKELFYSYFIQLKYHMAKVLKMSKESKIKFISIYLYLKHIVQFGPNDLEIDQFVICIDHIKNWPLEITQMEWSLAEWSLAQTDKLLKNLLSMEYYTDNIEGIQTGLQTLTLVRV